MDYRTTVPVILLIMVLFMFMNETSKVNQLQHRLDSKDLIIDSLKHEIDTGGILIQKECPIDSNETAGTLHDKLMILGADAMIETLHRISDQSIEETPQEESKNLKNAPKLFTHNTQVNWDMPGEKILNLIKGLHPYPIAHTLLDGKKLQVYRAEFFPKNHNHPSGIFFTDQKKYLAVSVPNGYVHILEIKLQGKRKMKIHDFLNGFNAEGLFETH